MSRIDLILISRNLLPILGEVGFNPRVLSDHASYWITLRLNSLPATYNWNLNLFWLTVVPALGEAATERVVNNLLFEKAEKNIYYSKQRHYECGERAGHLLAYLAHLDHKPPTVVSLRTIDGELLTDPDAVVHEFCSFFTSLYSSNTNNSTEEITSFLADIELPTLTPPPN